MNQQQKILSWLLRIIGFPSLLAMGAVVMPFSWMESFHEQLGLGTMPNAPIVEYLARSLSAFYALLGLVFCYVSFQVPQYWNAIRWIALLLILLGAILGWIGLKSQMPLWWTFQEALPTILLGFWMLYLHYQGSKSIN
jgi:hypothetical protein